MVRGKPLIIANVALGLVVVMLLLSLLGVELPTLGQARFYLDKEEPLCVVNWQEEFSEWKDIDACCLEARKQLGCDDEVMQLDSGRADWVCKTGEGKVLKYWLNNKAYNYCQQTSIW